MSSIRVAVGKEGESFAIYIHTQDYSGGNSDVIFREPDDPGEQKRRSTGFNRMSGENFDSHGFEISRKDSCGTLCTKTCDLRSLDWEIWRLWVHVRILFVMVGCRLKNLEPPPFGLDVDVARRYMTGRRGEPDISAAN